ncbi:hypothetical protein D3C75_508970 [compost metagenome]
MARRKAPENETQQEMEVRKAREEISNHATRSEKVSWERQYGNMQKLLEEKLQPIEDQILKLIGEKNKVFDEIVVLRDELIRDCIHPFEHVTGLPVPPGVVGTPPSHGTGTYVCTFCNKKVALNDVTK